MELRVRNAVIKTPIIDIINTLKMECEKRGKYFFKEIHPKHDYISVTCPYHKGGNENKASASFYSNYKNNKIRPATFNCFVCGESHTIEQVVAYCLDISKEAAENWLLKSFESDIIEESMNLPLISLNKLDTFKPTNNMYLDESILNDFQSWHPYMAQRKLIPSVCEKFKVKYDSKTNCIVFPVYDENNNLVMLTKRSIDSKNFYIDKDKEKPIYLMNYIKDNNIKEVTVTESQINTLTLWSWGYPAVATFGCNITPYQFSILNKSGVEHFYIAFDGDEAGNKGTKKFIQSMRKDIFIDVIELPKNKDINDLTEEEFSNLKIVDFSSWLLYNN